MCILYEYKYIDTYIVYRYIWYIDILYTVHVFHNIHIIIYIETMTCTNPPIFISVVQLTFFSRLQPPQKPLGVAAVNLQKLAPKNHELLPDAETETFHRFKRTAIGMWNVNVVCLFLKVWAHQKKSWGSACCWWRVFSWRVFFSGFPKGVFCPLRKCFEHFLRKMHQHEFVQDRMWYNRREGCQRKACFFYNYECCSKSSVWIALTSRDRDVPVYIEAQLETRTTQTSPC